MTRRLLPHPGFFRTPTRRTNKGLVPVRRPTAIGAVAIVAGFFTPVPARGATTPPQPGSGTKTGPTTATINAAQFQAMQAQIARLEAREKRSAATIARLKARLPMTGKLAAKIRQARVQRVYESVMRDVAKRQALRTGYSNGFYLQTPRGNNRLVVNGELQFRYMFGSARPLTPTAGTPEPNRLNTNDFYFRRARFSLSGNVLSPKLTFNFQGDFAGADSNNGDFQLINVWGAYALTKAVNIRFGSYAVPFSKLEWYDNDTGFDFSELPQALLPFDPDHSLGAGVFGDIVPNQVGYEAMINNGAQANTLGFPDVRTGASDNRLAFYGRIQWAGAGKETDFLNEPDMKGRRAAVWMIGLGLGADSQNSTASAFPSAQTSLLAAGLALPGSAGFLPPAAFNGNVYRATADYALKYRGLSFNAAAFYQQFQDRPAAGASTDAFRLAFGRGSLYQVGYYAEGGYFVIPRKWQVVGRFGELFNQGGGVRSYDYGLGLNYFLAGYYARLQFALSYVTRGPFDNSQTGTTINSADLITTVQAQLAF